MSGFSGSVQPYVDTYQMSVYPDERIIIDGNSRRYAAKTGQSPKNGTDALRSRRRQLVSASAR